MHEFHLGLGRGPVADVGAASLEILEVGAGRDLDVAVLAGHPDLGIELHGGGKAQVTGAHLHDAVGKLQGLQH